MTKHTSLKSFKPCQKKQQIFWYFCLNVILKSAPVTKLPSFLTVRKKSCLHPPAKKTRAFSGRMRICLAKWSVWRGSSLGTRRRPHGILLWWAHGLSSFCSLLHQCERTGAAAPCPLPHMQHCAVSSPPACVSPGRIMSLTSPSNSWLILY